MAAGSICSYCGNSQEVRKAHNSKTSYCPGCRLRHLEKIMLPEVLRNKDLAMLAAELKKHRIQFRPYIVLQRHSSPFVSSLLFYAGDKLCKLSVLSKPFGNPITLFWRGKVSVLQNEDFRLIRIGDGAAYRYRYVIVPVRELPVDRAFYIPIGTRRRPQRCLPAEKTLLRFESRWDLLKTESQHRVAS